MILAKPAPFVSAFIDAVDEAIRQDRPNSGMSALQRTWLAFCVTATLVTPSICWARFERASLGTYSMAALSWMFRHSKMPWDHLLVVSVRVILRHHGITSGSLVIDNTDNPRSKSAKKLAYLYKLRDKESGGYVWGPSLVVLLLVTPNISIPVGFVFYQPDPELSAWYRREKAHKKQKAPKAQRPPKPAPNPDYPTKQQLAACLKPSRPTILTSGFTVSRQMPSMGLPPLSMPLRRFSVGCKGCLKFAAIKTSASANGSSTSPTILPLTPARHSASVSEVVRRSWPWSAVPDYTSAPTKPNALWWP
jgi:hypothetical protein